MLYNKKRFTLRRQTLGEAPKIKKEFTESETRAPLFFVPSLYGFTKVLSRRIYALYYPQSIFLQ